MAYYCNPILYTPIWLLSVLLLTCSSPSDIDTQRVTIPTEGATREDFTLRVANISVASGSGYSDTTAISVWKYVVDTAIVYAEDGSSSAKRYSADIRLRAQPQVTAAAIVLDSLWIHLVNEPIDSTIILHHDPFLGSGLSATVRVNAISYQTRLLPRNFYSSIQLNRRHYSKQDTGAVPLIGQLTMVFDVNLPHTLKFTATIVMDP